MGFMMFPLLATMALQEHTSDEASAFGSAILGVAVVQIENLRRVVDLNYSNSKQATITILPVTGCVQRQFEAQ
ncbi:hypothetical protein FKW77_010135 [Venturia effusa]|uniref:Uncharacterized protein n=1 Tax=Venturia effusa TaxID=50376 RepID=A0A517L8D1_9PEZI|nr:hypothetical protein FKW77_010135 [Venturia effusa]